MVTQYYKCTLFKITKFSKLTHSQVLNYYVTLSGTSQTARGWNTAHNGDMIQSHTFTWKTKHDNNDTHCSMMRSLKAPLNAISISSSSFLLHIYTYKYVYTKQCQSLHYVTIVSVFIGWVLVNYKSKVSFIT